jgi:hypothetical protein
MKLHFTSGYHPKANGQTEQTNQTLEQYLHIYSNYQQDNWSHLLPLTEFAFNNSPSATTGILPFFANKGYHPNLSIHMERELTSTRAKEFVVDLDELHQHLQQVISNTQQQYQKYADIQRSTPPNFKIGDKVFVKGEFINTT